MWSQWISPIAASQPARAQYIRWCGCCILFYLSVVVVIIILVCICVRTVHSQVKHFTFIYNVHSHTHASKYIYTEKSKNNENVFHAIFFLSFISYMRFVCCSSSGGGAVSSTFVCTKHLHMRATRKRRDGFSSCELISLRLTHTLAFQFTFIFLADHTHTTKCNLISG